MTMGKALRKDLRIALWLSGGLLAALILYAFSQYNYLLFHSVIEGFCIVVAVLIFVLATRTFKYSGNGLLLFLGNAFLFIAVIDFFHTAAYKGMGIFPINSADMATQLWLAGRYLLAVTFPLAIVVTSRRFSSRLQIGAYAAATLLMLLSIMWLRNFPVAYIEGRGLTTFKIVSEYLISLVILAAMLLFYRQRNQLNPALYQMLMAAMACTILSEISFTLYTDVYGFMNFAGHIFKAISYGFIFVGVVLRGLDAPYETIFQDLQASAAMYRTIFENTGTATVIIDEDKTISLANNEFEILSGYSKGEVEHKKSWTDFISPKDREKCDWYHHLRRVTPETMPKQYEVDLINREGSIRNTLITVGIIPGTKKSVASFLDITERKQMEREMARLDRLHLVGEMAAGIGHEIRNPMTVVRGYLQLLQEKEELASYKKTFKTMIGELDRANSIITEYLSLAKNKAVHLKKQSLNSIVEAILPLIQVKAIKNNQSVTLELSDIPDLLLNSNEIRQIVLNLANNGLEAMHTNGTLAIRTYLDGTEVVLAVQNEGPEIPPEVLEKIGTPFFTTKDNGTGLGIAVCYSIAARHNASIRIETGSSGTTFFVCFKS